MSQLLCCEVASGVGRERTGSGGLKGGRKSDLAILVGLGGGRETKIGVSDLEEACL